MGVRVVEMGGDDEEGVEIQTVGGCGPVISVALYTQTQHINALVKTGEGCGVERRGETSCGARLRRWQVPQLSSKNKIIPP